MNRLRLEWSIFRKSLRVLKRNRPLLYLQIVNQLGTLLIIALLFPALLFAIPGITCGNCPSPLPFLILLLVLTPLVLLVKTFLQGVFFGEMIRGFGDDGVLLKRGLFFAFIKRKALLRHALHLMTHGRGNVFAVPTIICDEEAEEPAVVMERAKTTIRHIWHTKGRCRGFETLQLLPLLAFLLFMAGVLFAGHAAAVTVILCFAGGAILVLLLTAFIKCAEQVYIAALFCYAHGPDEVGEFTREELKAGF